MTSEERRLMMDALLEGELAEADFLRLEAEMSVDPVARREYYERVTLSMLLEAEATARITALDQGAPRTTVAEPTRRQWLPVFASTVAAICVVAFFAWQQMRPPNQEIETDAVVRGSVVETLASGFAVISGQADAVWGDGRTLADGSFAPSGELHLRSGAVQFELFSGVTLVVEGESRFTIHSPMAVTVAGGRVRARVPTPAVGFHVTTSRGDIVDLGTEFAVEVSESGQEIHVLDGEVEWHSRGNVPQRMEKGQAARWTDKGQSAITARTDGFLGPREMRERMQVRQTTRLDRWQKASARLRNDRRLTAYFSVTPADIASRQLRNLAVREGVIASDGAVVAATATANRFGQTQSALDFSPAGSRVRMSVPGEHRSLTLMCWVRINSLDRWYNSLFLTDGHDQGEPHWQIMDDGRLFFSVKKRDQYDAARGEKDKHVYYSPPFWKTELSGQWLMIATVYDVDTRRVSHYLDGKLLSEEAIPEEYLVETIRIGNASIGNWGLPERDEPRFAVRNLNGSLDEFALFSSALSAQEIRQIYDDGKP